MKISFVEIQNFRKLRSVRIDLAADKTLFVGANNSGKTSAMIALAHFMVDSRRFTSNDFTLSHWAAINKLGYAWENWKEGDPHVDLQKSLLEDWAPVLPAMDIWLEIEKREVHHVSHILPRLKWKGEPIGVRLRFEPKKIKDLYEEFLKARLDCKLTIATAQGKGKGIGDKVKLWPSNLQEFLDRKLHAHFVVRHYILDPSRIVNPLKGLAVMQAHPVDREPLDGNPLSNLVRVDQIQAQRGFSDAGHEGSAGGTGEDQTQGASHRLSAQLRKYYAAHLDPSEKPAPEDVEALEALSSAQEVFNERLKVRFKEPFDELEGLGYPGLTNPKLRLSIKVEPADGLKHSSALQYDVIGERDEEHLPCPSLPEQYNGLGYQNLISIVFRLMSFRDAWMRVGKADKREEEREVVKIPPLHLVLIEEPEAHLHAQVQQVFIRRAYEFLRKHSDLGSSNVLHTQMVVSTHSSHIVHEVEFSSLRYFRRLPAIKRGESPTTVVVNMSEVFGRKGKTAKFVARYLRATHCDLFFADAAIMVEGPAERLLIPHFIRGHFPDLSHRYLTLLDIGGSHAHRLKPLIEHLGLTSLIVTDIDAAKKTVRAQRVTLSSVRTERGKDLATANATLRLWHPKIREIDALLDLEETKKVVLDDFWSVRVAYQIPVSIEFPSGSANAEFLPYTFEDAVIAENVPVFQALRGPGLIKVFKDSLRSATDVGDLSKRLFEALRDGDKAEFATNLIFTLDPKSLNVPSYVKNGLKWLSEQLNEKDRENLAPTGSEVIVTIQQTSPEDASLAANSTAAETSVVSSAIDAEISVSVPVAVSATGEKIPHREGRRYE